MTVAFSGDAVMALLLVNSTLLKLYFSDDGNVKCLGLQLKPSLDTYTHEPPVEVSNAKSLHTACAAIIKTIAVHEMLLPQLKSLLFNAHC